LGSFNDEESGWVDPFEVLVVDEQQELSAEESENDDEK